MNQTVVRMYLLIVVGVLAVVFAVWPRIPLLQRRPIGLLRFAVVLGVGLAVVMTAFETAGRVDGLYLRENRAYLWARFPGRAWGDSVWTALNLSDGSSEVLREVPEGLKPVSLPARSDTMQLTRSLRTRLRRPTGRAGPPSEPIGPTLEQPTLAHATGEFAVVAAYDTVYRPETLYLANFGLDGGLRWRREAAEIGLDEGRLRRSALLPDGDVLLVFSGLRANRTWLERATFDTHLVVTRVDPQTGQVRWTKRL